MDIIKNRKTQIKTKSPYQSHPPLMVLAQEVESFLVDIVIHLV